ncbi:FAD-dependent monooxygenase [Mycobacterium sp. SMC-18]|uniref:FAD-dependent monooxygenase n=1 Tax=Mycobacteriaceae TaxID=1762 RepID=UPI001BB44DD4|nr:MULTISPECIES: FAD-dependent monooxygenase [unclassified Mycolicibacterium]BCI81056.1 flavin-dependent oxidoreductase [Mycolicibacterium sp. TY66]BCJ81285.1 flavin-dependent oxidoreductase [Mycolicibacterium sp. TY81]
MTPVLIAGAGIGGLTTALTLHARGFDALVLERAHDLQPLGVGINLLPHAVRELTELGLGDALTAMAVAPSAIRFYTHRGDLLFTEPRGLAAGDAYPQLSVHRGRLQMMLLDAVRERLGADAVRTGSGVTGFRQHADGVVVDTAAGEVAGSALVGADGINSVVRAALHPGDDPLLSSGITMYRGACDITPFLDGHTMAIVKADNGVDLITYPIGGGQVNWVLQVPAGQPGPLQGDAKWNAPATADDVLPHVADWHLDWLDMDALIGRTPAVFSYPMVDKDPLPHWGDGRVTLLGDAAHPMYPVGANGASQSIVDARVLADELASHGFAGLRSYERARLAETADVIAANREMHVAGASRAPADLARVTTRYRTETANSTRGGATAH